MARCGGGSRIFRTARLAALALACLALANCSNSKIAGKVDPKYGVKTSARVIEPGQPVPKGGGTYRVGKPYQVAGRTYVPEEDVNYKAEGIASWYGDAFHGRYTANGEIFDMNSISAAHPTLPIPSYVRVTNLRNKRSLVVRVNDRGPYAHDRIIDLSARSANLLGFAGKGTAPVRVEYIGKAPLEGSDDRKLMATLREHGPGLRPVSEPEIKVASASNTFVPTYFDARPLTQVPPPAARPYRLGNDAAPAHESTPPRLRRPTTEPAATARAQAVQKAELPRAVAQAAPSPTPVSAYAAPRYDRAAGFMSGRGLY